MKKTLFTGMFLALSTCSVVLAQDFAAQGPNANPTQPTAAPIVRELPAGMYDGSRRGNAQQLFETQPGPGIFVRSDASSGVQTVSSSAGSTELRVTAGRANVTLHHPADHSEILVDLPGGQVSLLKDGVYTFNASTNTVRVLRGEAEVFNSKTATKGVKIKEDQQLAFFANAKLKAVDAYPNEIGADLLATGDGARGYGRREVGYGEGFYGGGYGYGGYGYGGYGYPYYAGLYGGPWGYGSGFGYGYPIGIGIGYYGGFGGYYGGGFRGGYGGFGGIRGFGRRR